MKVRVPVDGGFADQEFTATFRVLPWSEVEKLDTDPVQLLRAIWIGWDGIVDDDGQPIPFSDALRDQLIDTLYIRAATVTVYVNAMTGVARGN
ncbi:hypothetical protein [Paracoccus sp. (in: a-proteobacteria)]|uniref:hypothetical protein n=1 Tax=Paracoccus sp. TaxID=267 RepID=UPI0026E04FB5|nr:hypothetical protein [Paracoccus sp. (in: a-proteobacteria)]